jgi:hypothetical protein
VVRYDRERTDIDFIKKKVPGGAARKLLAMIGIERSARVVWARGMCEGWSLEYRGAVVRQDRIVAGKIPFPGNRDFGSKRRGSTV